MPTPRCKYNLAVPGTRIRLTGALWVRIFNGAVVESVVTRNTQDDGEGIYHQPQQGVLRRIPPYSYLVRYPNEYTDFDFEIVREDAAV